MSNAISELTTAATSGGTAAALVASGRPTEEVVVWSLLGALVAVWLKSREEQDPDFNWRLLSSIVGILFVSVFCGIVGSAIFVGAVQAHEKTKGLVLVPQWAVAFVVAALIHTVAPLLYDFAKRWLKKKVGKNV